MTAAPLAAARPGTAAPLLAEPHHDGSDGFVLERPDEPGGEAVLRLRVPRATAVDGVVLRYVRDAEPRAVRAEVDSETETDTWWRASFPAWNPITRYRWLLHGGGTPGGYAWVNGLGVVDHDVPDDDDFVLSLDPGGPDWHLRSVVYEVFPDRFAASGSPVEAPAWAVRREWDAPPTGRGPTTSREWYGGDLGGLERHFDHVEAVGGSVLYLTPIFPAGSVHRYDASSFERVDPVLGGDGALVSLVAAAHARGIRVIGDLTLNHTGDEHDWFLAARADDAAPEREFFHFDDALPNGYESWLGVRSLPKLDHRSPELARRLEGVVRRWLEPPFELDGWRIDVANMAGRYRDLDGAQELARTVRQALTAARADALLIAEHGHDARDDLGGEGWHGTMNYSGFTRPMWCWLRGDDLDMTYLGLPVPVPHLDGAQVTATMRAFRAGVPWASTLHSWTLLDSHDTARFRTVAGSRDRQLVGVGLQMTTPGVPMVFAGDELGLKGDYGEDARRTMPWGRQASWDRVLLDEYRRLAALRRSSDALARGGIRYAFVDADVIAYLRESPAERLLVLASREAHAPVHIPLAGLGAAALETVYGADASIESAHAVLPAEGPSFHVWRLIDG
jgi:alpha-glucosidase